MDSARPSAGSGGKSEEMLEHKCSTGGSAAAAAAGRREGVEVGKPQPSKATTGAPAGPRTKVLFLVRHAQGEHNYAAGVHGVKAYKSWDYEDARLDATGLAQAAKLQAAFAAASVPLDMVLCSPLTRTLQTATISFKHSNAPIVVVEALREAFGAHPCDRRRPRDVLEKEFPHVDLQLLPHGDDSLWTEQRETYPSVIKRAAEFVEYLTGLPDSIGHVAVVTHGVFLDCLMKHCLTVPPEFDTSHFGNAEVRALRLRVGGMRTAASVA